jgi:hypothetical protein
MSNASTSTTSLLHHLPSLQPRASQLIQSRTTFFLVFPSQSPMILIITNVAVPGQQGSAYFSLQKPEKHTNI